MCIWPPRSKHAPARSYEPRDYLSLLPAQVAKSDKATLSCRLRMPLCPPHPPKSLPGQARPTSVQQSEWLIFRGCVERCRTLSAHAGNARNGGSSLSLRHSRQQRRGPRSRWQLLPCAILRGLKGPARSREESFFSCPTNTLDGPMHSIDADLGTMVVLPFLAVFPQSGIGELFELRQQCRVFAGLDFGRAPRNRPASQFASFPPQSHVISHGGTTNVKSASYLRLGHTGVVCVHDAFT